MTSAASDFLHEIEESGSSFLKQVKVFRQEKEALMKEKENIELEKISLQMQALDIEKERSELIERHNRLDAERDKIRGCCKDTDIIHLDIGGVMVRCQRSTLTQIENSFLSSMFSGRWEEGLSKDREGNIFLDFNPDCFLIILNWLRAYRIEGKNASFPEVRHHLKRDFLGLVSYLGLQNELPEDKIATPVSFSVNTDLGWKSLLTKSDSSSTLHTGGDATTWAPIRVDEEMRTGRYIFMIKVQKRVAIDCASSRDRFMSPRDKLARWDTMLHIDAKDKEKKTIKVVVDCDARKFYCDDYHENDHFELNLEGDGPHKLYVALFGGASVSFDSVRHI